MPQDIITGDEIISDSYDLKEIDGIVYEADCAMITEGAVVVSTSNSIHKAGLGAGGRKNKTKSQHEGQLRDGSRSLTCPFPDRHWCQRFR